MLTDSKQLDWAAAKVAAERIARICSDAAYTAPEALLIHGQRLAKVAEQMTRIAAALILTRAP
jgi:hypothetical protein